VSGPVTSSRRVDREDNLLWLNALLPIFAWIAAQQIDFIVSPWVCATGNRWVLYAVTGLALLTAAAGGLGSWRQLRRMGAESGREDEVRARRRFMAGGGVLVAAIFFLAILALAIPAVVHRPCD
jgi:hypothetical protein